MKFDHYIPGASLRPFIKTIVVSEQDTGNSYKVFPDTSIVIGIQYTGSLAIEKNGIITQLSPAGITGLQDRYNVFSQRSHTATLLVYFTATGASAFFPGAVHILFRQSVSLDEMFPASTVERLRETLHDAISDTDRVRAVEEFLLAAIRKPETDRLVVAAVQLINQGDGRTRIEELPRRLYTSPSPLEKRFRAVVGTTPKKFASIVRFRSAMALFDRSASLTDLAHTAGYFDQSHFIHDFSKMTGVPPSRHFSGNE